MSHLKRDSYRVIYSEGLSQTPCEKCEKCEKWPCNVIDTCVDLEVYQDYLRITYDDDNTVPGLHDATEECDCRGLSPTYGPKPRNYKKREKIKTYKSN